MKTKKYFYMKTAEKEISITLCKNDNKQNQAFMLIKYNDNFSGIINSKFTANNSENNSIIR